MAKKKSTSEAQEEDPQKDGSDAPGPDDTKPFFDPVKEIIRTQVQRVGLDGGDANSSNEGLIETAKELNLLAAFVKVLQEYLNEHLEELEQDGLGVVREEIRRHLVLSKGGPPSPRLLKTVQIFRQSTKLAHFLEERTRILHTLIGETVSYMNWELTAYQRYLKGERDSDESTARWEELHLMNQLLCPRFFKMANRGISGDELMRAYIQDCMRKNMKIRLLLRDIF